jgi:uncharacterized membrane protein YagU involved in acid resistance
MQKAFISAVSGTLATLPMTATMLYLKKHYLPFYLKYPMPPRLITINLLRRLGLMHKLNSKREFILSMVSHFSFGSFAASSFYPLLPHIQLPRVLAGMSYGVGIWIFSYLGIIPGMQLLPSALKAPPRRNAFMLLSHLVWGGSLAILTRWLELGFKKLPQQLPQTNSQK